jgi:hypothetical protein
MVDPQINISGEKVTVVRTRDLTTATTILSTDTIAIDKVALLSTEAMQKVTVEELKNAIILKQTIHLTSAELLACGTPILKMATPPTGYHYRIHRATTKIDFKTTAYSIPAGLNRHISLRYVGQTKYSNYIVKLPLDFVEETETSYMACECGEGQIVNNAGMEVYCPVGNLTLGDSDIYWDIYYSIEPNL